MEVFWAWLTSAPGLFPVHPLQVCSSGLGVVEQNMTLQKEDLVLEEWHRNGGSPEWP